MNTIEKDTQTEARIQTIPSPAQPPMDHLGITFTPTLRLPLPEEAPEVDINRILVVDDEVMITEVLRRALTSKFHGKVTTASDGEEAIGLLQRNSFDMVISDVRMPRISGLGLLDWILAHIPALRSRFLFMTGDTGSLEATEKIASHGIKVLRKPFSMELLFATCREILPVRPQPILIR